jgi:ComF family protein
VQDALRWLDRAANATVRLLLAPVCAACGGLLDRPFQGPVCGSCWRGVALLTPPWCERCGDVLPSWRTSSVACARCRRVARRFEAARSAGRYDGALREMVHAFKYGHRRMLARPLAALIARAAADLLAGADAVVPVPLHPWRAWQRGFNQADDLARHLGPPVWPALRRRRAGPPQASLPAARRHANVRGAFALGYRPGAPITTAWRRLLRDRVVVLVDDVMTTGATLDACGQVLQDAGVRTVRAVTVARAVTTPPGSPRPSPDPSTAPRR